MNIYGKPHKELLLAAQKHCILPLLSRLHKGQAGRVAVIGGSEDYTGAPYFSAHACALMGCDLTHVVCEPNAAAVIKTYTPNLMVHPYLDGTQPGLEKLWALVKRMHVLVLGPGLGRSAAAIAGTESILEHVLNTHQGRIPVVIDADGLYAVARSARARTLLAQFPRGRVVLTPNVVEFERLCDAADITPKPARSPALPSSSSASQTQTDGRGRELAEALHCIVLQKGSEDRIYAPRSATAESAMLVNAQQGSNKRVGGQGDTLTGTIACMLAFSRARYDFELTGTREEGLAEWTDYAMLSCYVGCTVTRECARLAFERTGRAMQTTDLNNRVGEVYAELFGS